MINKLKQNFFSDGHLTELLKGSSIAFIFRIVGMGFGYVLTLMITRWYGADTMGLFSLSITLLNIFATIGVFGFDNSLVKFIADYNSNGNLHLIKEVYQKSLYLVLPLTIFLSVLLFFGSEIFAVQLFKNDNLIQFFNITSLGVVPFVLLRINFTVFRALKYIELFSFFQNVGIYLGAIAILSLSRIENFDKSISIISQVFSMGFMMLVSFKYIKSHTRIIETMSQNILEYKNIIKVSFAMLLTNSIGLIMAWSDIIMLGIFRSESDVGIYSVVVKLAALTSITLMAINTIAAPKFAELYSKGDMNSLKNIAKSSSKMMFFSSLPVILVLILLPEYILGIFGAEFIVGTIPLWILMAGQFVNTSCGSVGYVLQMAGYEKEFQYIMIVALIINIVLNYILASEYGAIGVAFATSIALIVWNVGGVILMKNKLGFTTILNFRYHAS